MKKKIIIIVFWLLILILLWVGWYFWYKQWYFDWILKTMNLADTSSVTNSWTTQTTIDINNQPYTKKPDIDFKSLSQQDE